MRWLQSHMSLSVGLALGVLAIISTSVWIWFDGAPDAGNKTIVQTFSSPATMRLDRDMSRLLALMDDVERGVSQAGEACERCAYLAQTASAYRERAETALSDIRVTEAALSTLDSSDPKASEVTLRRQLASDQRTAARAVAGLKSYANAMRDCESEQLCQRHDLLRAVETQPLDCSRDAAPVRDAAARISELSKRVIEQARQCQSMSCPVMDCERSSSFVSDLTVAEISLAQLAGGRTALPGVVEQSSPTGLAAVLGGVERALVRLAIDSAETSLEPDALAARASDMREGLLGWVEEMELRRGVQKQTWRVGALMAEIDVAAEWARRDQTEEYTQAYFEALSRAMLSAARLDAALAMEDEAAQSGPPSVAGPICGANELAAAYLKVGQAIAALNFCQAKSACPRPSSAATQRSLRSASDRTIGALAAVTGALPLGLERAQDADVTASSPVELSQNRSVFRTGEAITVSADTTPSACLISDGSISIARAGTIEDRQQRFALPGNAKSEILLAAPRDPGNYTVRIFASPDRGGHTLSEHALTVDSLEPGCAGFTGAWETEFGRLYLVERDGEITGSYRKGNYSPLPGILVATHTDNVLEGTWLSELGRGGARLRLAEGGESFSGTWGVKVGRVTGGGRWTGECVR